MKRMWPFRHLGLKVWSAALAVMLWMIVAGEETVERGLRVPLELQQFPNGLELLADALSRVGPGDIIGVLDLRTARAGRRLFQMTPEQIRVPVGVQVVQVTPPSIALSFENSATRQVPVVPAVEGSPAPGFVVGQWTSDPKTIEVVGPESAVQRVTEALTEPLSVSGANRDVTESVTVGFLDPLVRVKTPRLASVTVQILPGPVERTLHGRPVHLRGVGLGLSAQCLPSAVDVVVRGSKQGVARVDAGGLEAFVDLAGVGAGEYMLGVRVDASQDAGVARIDPATVQVRIFSAK
jgi:YbbR domain-containing protein